MDITLDVEADGRLKGPSSEAENWIEMQKTCKASDRGKPFYMHMRPFPPSHNQRDRSHKK